jgi:hypothetical protein
MTFTLLRRKQLLIAAISVLALTFLLLSGNTSAQSCQEAPQNQKSPSLSSTHRAENLFDSRTQDYAGR